MDIEQQGAISLIIFGRTGVGKSSLINAMALSGSNRSSEIPKLSQEGTEGILVDIGHTLISKTKLPQNVEFKLAGYKVQIMDTPGFLDNRKEMDVVTLMGEILGSIQRLNAQGGFHLGLFCISALDQRVDEQTLSDIFNFCCLLGENCKKHIKIVLTQINRLGSDEEKKKVKRNYQKNLAEVFKSNRVDIDTSDMLWADFDDFDTQFTKNLKKMFDASPSKCVPIIKVDINDKDSVLKAMASKEIKSILARKEEELKFQQEKNELLAEQIKLQKSLNENQMKTLQLLETQIQTTNKMIEDFKKAKKPGFFDKALGYVLPIIIRFLI